MKKIYLTRGKYAIVDDEDFKILNMHRWYCSNHGYAVRGKSIGGIKRSISAKFRDNRLFEKRKLITVPMHRQILNCPDDMVVDHINGDKLDNRKENLRICTSSENVKYYHESIKPIWKTIKEELKTKHTKE